MNFKIKNSSDSVPARWAISNVFYNVEKDDFISNPLMIHYEEKYYLFYTNSLTTDTTKNTSIVQVSGKKINELNNKKRLVIINRNIKITQLLYSRSQQLWYLFGFNVPDNKPVFFTNPDINNTKGWSSSNELKIEKDIADYQIVVDDSDIYVFYINKAGKLNYSKIHIDNLPKGFDSKQNKRVVFNNEESCKIRNISRIIYSDTDNEYLAFYECDYNDGGGGLKLYRCKTLDDAWSLDKNFDLNTGNIVNTDGSNTGDRIIKNCRPVEIVSGKKTDDSDMMFVNQTKLTNRTSWEFSIIMNK